MFPPGTSLIENLRIASETNTDPALRLCNALFIRLKSKILHQHWWCHFSLIFCDFVEALQNFIKHKLIYIDTAFYRQYLPMTLLTSFYGTKYTAWSWKVDLWPYKHISKCYNLTSLQNKFQQKLYFQFFNKCPS